MIQIQIRERLRGRTAQPVVAARQRHALVDVLGTVEPTVAGATGASVLQVRTGRVVGAGGAVLAGKRRAHVLARRAVGARPQLAARAEVGVGAVSAAAPVSAGHGITLLHVLRAGRAAVARQTGAREAARTVVPAPACVGPPRPPAALMGVSMQYSSRCTKSSKQGTDPRVFTPGRKALLFV